MKDFKLNNYTTKIDSSVTIAEIEQILVSFGATCIVKDYLNGTINAVMFSIGKEGYKLPANTAGVEELFKKNRSVYSKVSVAKIEEQAKRVVWRIIKDWLHNQLSLIATKQAEPGQVLLPYLFDGKRTLYEAYKEGDMKLLSNDDKENRGV